MDLQLAHDIISICNEANGGATVEDCAEQLGITGARLADVFDTFEELVRSEKLIENRRRPVYLGQTAPGDNRHL